MHLWDLRLEKNHWLLAEPSDSFLGDYRNICRDYLPQDYRNERAEWPVANIVHVQAGWQADDAPGETAWLQAMAEQTGLPAAIVGFTDFTADNVEQQLAQHCQHNNMRGIRQIINWHPDAYYSGAGQNYLAHPQWAKGYAQLADYDLSFDCQLYPQQMPIFHKIAQQHEAIPVAIEHCGMPLFRQQGDEKQWRQALKQLAQLPHTVIKLSGLGMFFKRWHIDDVKDIVNYCFDIFGVERCLFGSNFPVESLYTNFEQMMAVWLALTSAFSEHERDQFFYVNAQRFYRIDPA